MSETVHGLDDDRNGRPLVGALLRAPFMSARGEVVRSLHAAGFTDLLPAHLAVFQHPGPQGRSPGEIARAANASKQAVNNLLSGLERAGYLVRRVNPGNRRERTIELTDRGRDAIRTMRAAVAQVELRWQQELGRSDYDQLRSTLERLNSLLSDPDAATEPAH